MASISISAAYLHPADNLSGGLEVGWTSLMGDTAPRGEVRMMAGGAKRAVEWPGIDERLTIEIPYLDYSDWHKMTSWLGKAVVWRDNAGRLTWARMDKLSSRDDNMFDDRITSLSLILTPVSGTAEV